MVFHPIEPVYNSESKILILGSFPSVKSREENFYYAHPQNRFWKIISMIFDEEIPITIDDKISILLKNKIALWDVINSCEIYRSSDSTIKNVVPNDISRIIYSSKVNLVVLNGQTSGKYFQRFFNKSLEISSIILPSTSPANASFSIDALYQNWKILKEYL